MDPIAERATPWALPLLSLLLLWLASQRIYTWPLPRTWEISIGVTEWGHWLALVATVVLLASLRRSPAAAGVALLAGLIAALPALQARTRLPDFSFQRLWTLPPNMAPSRTVSYANGQAMDLYLPPASPSPSPLVIVVHGGSWCRGSRQDFTALNGHLCQRGFVVASIDYRLAPGYPYPAALEDLQAALDYLVDSPELRVDPDRVYFLGRSAGAHLALLAAYKEHARSSGALARQGRRLRGVIGFYPPTDMEWSYDHPSDPRILDSKAAIRDFMTGTPEERGDLYKDASPLRQADAHAPATLLLHGDIDNLVYPEQTRRLARRLEQLQVPHRVVMIPWANHGFDVNLSGPSGQISTHAVEAFLEGH